MIILQINTSDIGGGAEKIANDLHKAYLNLGKNSLLAVGFTINNQESVFKIHEEHRRLKTSFKNKFARYVSRTFHLDWPAFLRWSGFEDIYYPRNKFINNFDQNLPDIIHAHNLHGGYFNLNSLIELSAKIPILITLHDEWLFTGHCACTIDCHNWIDGCGHCPDLDRYPKINHDLTHLNYRIKNRILQKSIFSVVTPSVWMASQLNKSSLLPFLTKVIPNGVNQAVFNHLDTKESKKELGFDLNEVLILYIAAQGKNNPYKDYDTIAKTIDLISTFNFRSEIVFISIGGNNSKITKLNNIKILEIPFINDQIKLSQYYKASDIFIHASITDNFPTTILESLSCGIPVIATAIGGIPEQIINGETGFLVPPKDATSMAQKIELLINNPQLRTRMGENAFTDAKARFSLDLMAERYLFFYAEVIEDWHKRNARFGH
ncbi:MAG: hypothetical protein BGO78_15830 [Chloroflexi bacterium 44-23]|nr:MAG: hypothetical protein BGO78_15830 [Chloroflexi bacterium 44-23]